MEDWENQNFEAEWKKAFDGAEFTPSNSIWHSIEASLKQSGNLAGDEKTFERGWKKAFDDAEVMPSSSVWEMLNVRLIQAENVAMRSRVLFYQRLAAASVVVLFLVSGYFLLKPADAISNQAITQSDGTKSNTNTTPVLSNEAKQKDESATLALTNSTGGSSLNQLKQGKAGNSHLVSSGFKNLSQKGLVLVGEQNNKIESSASTENSANPGNGFSKNTSQLASIALLPIENLLPKTVKPDDYSIAYRIADLMPAAKLVKKKSNLPEKSWATVALAAGNYMPGATGNDLMPKSPGSQASSFTSLQNRQTLVKDEKIKPGASLSFAVMGGKRIFKRWIMQGGIGYLNQTSQSNSSTVAVAPANKVSGPGLADAYSPEATSSVTYTTPNQINSTFQFISFPMQAGYMIVDRKFGVQLNGGVAPDFFWRSSVYDQSSQTETINSATGTNNTFKAVSVTGLGGVEVSYRFSKRYRISVVPGFRYSLTPIYKENYLASAKPFVADIGLKFRYVFDN